ncbi:hypothetical protein CFHF_01225 [Caulobacter flavus]|uniref:Uncharacterized protein n=1 Tax=Caulobacter flavus TaxID=1679497 RepID=A0A2N5D4V8_9CAUL|nr:hypothetical protein [Caulobacter flavus]AYV47128.1 hypothetical protein C1707_13135 [Caulobacter flavus]PLR21104.1 hypothetical protein CFHF_01225 [Caulobacter flavus]
MSASEPADPAAPSCEWTNHGRHDWTGRGPNGENLVYAGQRTALLEGRGYGSRWSSTLAVTRRGMLPAVLMPENSLDRLAKRIGYTVEHQTGDADFDARIHLACDDAEPALRLAETPALRRAVLHLLDSGVKRLTVDHEGVTVELRERLRPDGPDAEHDLWTMSEALCAVAALWPENRAKSRRRWFRRETAALIWGAMLVAAAPITAFDDETFAERQIETYVQTDWLGLAVWLALALIPLAAAGFRRASGHRALVALAACALAVAPFSQSLLQRRANTWFTRAQTDVPAELTDLRVIDSTDNGPSYEATIMVADRATDWALTPHEGQLAAEGRLCAAGVVATGLRDLRYVKGVRTWACRPSLGGEPDAAQP